MGACIAPCDLYLALLATYCGQHSHTIGRPYAWPSISANGAPRSRPGEACVLDSEEYEGREDDGAGQHRVKHVRLGCIQTLPVFVCVCVLRPYMNIRVVSTLPTQLSAPLTLLLFIYGVPKGSQQHQSWPRRCSGLCISFADSSFSRCRCRKCPVYVIIPTFLASLGSFSRIQTYLIIVVLSSRLSTVVTTTNNPYHQDTIPW